MTVTAFSFTRSAAQNLGQASRGLCVRESVMNWEVARDRVSSVAPASLWRPWKHFAELQKDGWNHSTNEYIRCWAFSYESLLYVTEKVVFLPSFPCAIDAVRCVLEWFSFVHAHICLFKLHGPFMLSISIIDSISCFCTLYALVHTQAMKEVLLFLHMTWAQG